MKFILIFLGGGLGSVLRYLISKYFNAFDTVIPYGTFLVNILGSLFIGILLGLSLRSNMLNHNQTLFLAVGFCGGFTTFSTFAFESTEILESGDYFNLALYLIGSIVLGILAIFLGLYLAK